MINMWRIILYFMCVTFFGVSAENKTDAELSMEKAYVVPDILPKAPREFLKVHYRGGVEVNMGNQLSPKQVEFLPEVSWPAEPYTHYTLCMSDPDGPSPKKYMFREWQHWIIVNIPGNDTSLGDTVTEYLGPFPLPNTGIHRYVFLLFKQPHKIKFYEPHITKKEARVRRRFSARYFSLNYELGRPIAGNYFHSTYDNYVDKIFRRLDHNIRKKKKKEPDEVSGKNQTIK